MVDQIAAHARDISYIREACDRQGLRIYAVHTELGEVGFTLEGEHQGQIWAGPMRVNGADHLMVGRYRFFYEHEGMGESWAPNTDKPVVNLGGYPGLKRLHGEGYGIEPTAKSREKISRVFGRAMEPLLTSHLQEAVANERELAAQECDRKATAAGRDAERWEDMAANIRAGGPFTPLVHR